VLIAKALAVNAAQHALTSTASFQKLKISQLSSIVMNQASAHSILKTFSSL
jgi:hypothetical protein